MGGRPEVKVTAVRNFHCIIVRAFHDCLRIRSWGADRFDDIRAEEEAGKHRLLEGEEEQHKDDGIDDGDDVLRPSPTHRVSNGSTGDQAETVYFWSVLILK